MFEYLVTRICYKTLKFSISIEICSVEISYQIFPSDSHWTFDIGPRMPRKMVRFVDGNKSLRIHIYKLVPRGIGYDRE